MTPSFLIIFKILFRHRQIDEKYRLFSREITLHPMTVSISCEHPFNSQINDRSNASTNLHIQDAHLKIFHRGFIETTD